MRARKGRRHDIAVAGCVPRPRRRILARQSTVDLVVGPQSYHRLPEMVAKLAREGGHALETIFLRRPNSISCRTGLRRRPAAFLTCRKVAISSALSAFVPYTRAANIRSYPSILPKPKLGRQRRARNHVSGQNVNAYRGAGPDGETWTLARLIMALAKWKG